MRLAGNTAEQDRIFYKCAWRLIPFIMLLYVISFIDRSNVGFAALTMNKDLGFSPSVFGFGAGIFFIGYVLFQVPVAVLLERAGARRLIFCIMAIWGLISASNAFVHGLNSFYALRFLLGLAEAGFFPGMIFYLTLWFPRAYRGRFSATFSSGIPLAGIIGGPLSGLILGMDGTAGLHGWQWLFLMQGLPASLLAFAVLKYLPDSPADAKWLNDTEKNAITARLTAEVVKEDRSLLQTLRDRRVLSLGVAAFGNGCALYGITLWLPQIVQAMGFTNRTTGFVTAFPYVAGMIAMIVWGRSSDLRDERIWHVALAMVLAAAGFVGASLTQNHILMLLALTLAVMGVLASFGPFYSLPSSFLRGSAAAGGIALVNTLATLGGFCGPVIIGVLKERTGGYAVAMSVFALGLVLAAFIVLAIGRAIVPPRTIIQQTI
jgi:ACS family tartrate transporter-like MFS transporter